jgi:hypothetical protein
LSGLVAASVSLARPRIIAVYVRPFGSALNELKMTIEIEVKSQPCDGTIGAI